MRHIDDYLNDYNNISFSEMPFNEVDALILAQFTYMKLEGYVPYLKAEAANITLTELNEVVDRDVIFMDKRHVDDNRKMWDLMLAGKRFANMGLNYIWEMMDEERETQFCAFTVFPEGASPVILFRGTDESIIGWVEDFNMAFSTPFVGQRLGLLYLKHVAQWIDGTFMMSGHSKGGNIAVFSAMMADKDIQDRVEIIYNFDGPGFRPEIIDQDGYYEIRNRVVKYMPQSSVIGMLLENQEEYTVVKSSSVGGMLQHNPFTWVLEDKSFSILPGKREKHRTINDSFNKWILGLSEEQQKSFVGTVEKLADATKETTLTEFVDNWNKSIPNLIRSIMDFDKETKSDIKELFVTFGNVLAEEIRADNGK
ncbi:MAG: DUF2974 domain-containing protein [Lachnospiraceae bacterium]|nr:DUF2974 domain-containing protein [Lachnospiraceae bacterium]